jgi:hypothetical protein
MMCNTHDLRQSTDDRIGSPDQKSPALMHKRRLPAKLAQTLVSILQVATTRRKGIADVIDAEG